MLQLCAILILFSLSQSLPTIALAFQKQLKQAQLNRLLLTWQPERYPESCVMCRIYLNSSTKKTVLNFPTQINFHLLGSAKITLSHAGMQSL